MTVSVGKTVLVVLAAACFALGVSNFVGGENRVRAVSLGLLLATIALGL